MWFLGAIAVLGHAPLRTAGAGPDSRPGGGPRGSLPVQATSRPVDLLAGGTARVLLQVPGQDRLAACWIRRPAGYGPGQRPPLVVALHGTDDTAEQMVEFWGSRRMQVPAIIAAPQGVEKGWTSQDVPAIRALFDYLAATLPFDSRRVLLTGFSAGGAMTFQMVYKESVPVTAAAALANYVPPRITAEEVRNRRQLPVFYAVGMADINHELMRTGLDFLRAAGADVQLYHPSIGHRLDPQVAQAALDWFFDRSSRQTGEEIDQAGGSPDVAAAAIRLEEITTQPAWFPADQFRQAADQLARIQAPGQRQIKAAEEEAGRGEWLAAVEQYQAVETRYGASMLGQAARVARERIEADPVTRARLELQQSERHRTRAMAEYARAQQQVAQRRLKDAAQTCRLILADYADTPAAERARRLLEMLERRSQ